jgi:hypothetical protein
LADMHTLPTTLLSAIELHVRLVFAPHTPFMQLRQHSAGTP